MQVSVESTGKLERRMQVQVPAERVSEEIAARLKTISRTARLNGFRPGKAPLKVIRQQFGPQVHREVIGELLQSSYAEAVTQKQLTPAGNPRIEPQSMDEGQDLTYVATFEVFPEVALQPVESLELERISAEVAESDIDTMIERLRKQQVKYVAAARPAAIGDKVTIDFLGKIEGGLPKLREDVAANMRRELEQAVRNRNKAAVMEKLYAANPTEVPNVLIEGQIRDMQVEAMRRAGIKDAAQAPPRDPFVEPARRRVTLGLLLNDVIRKENLVVDRARVNERLDEMVSAYGDAAAMKRAYMQNADAMRQVEGLALEDQAVDWILGVAKVREVPSTFKELMNFEA